eukprot:m.333517 g.333517  ORF g.333517 m.333517 type:complete len:650 (-) comp19780_c0_seq24:179-2128(-)
MAAVVDLTGDDDDMACAASTPVGGSRKRAEGSAAPSQPAAVAAASGKSKRRRVAEGGNHRQAHSSRPAQDVTDPIALHQQLAVVEGEIAVIDDQIAALRERKHTLVRRQEELSLLSTEAKASRIQDWTGQFDWDEKVDGVLKRLGHSSFRSNQREVINATLCNVDVFLIMPTGGGKTLTFLIPAVVDGGLTVVISPLLSLMQDQVQQMQQAGINAGHLSGDTPQQEAKAMLQSLSDDDGSKLLYITPEKLAKSKTLLSRLEKSAAAGRLKRFVIDEAHACSQWGHDFRPDYKALGMLKQQFPQTPIMALTATATLTVEADVKDILRIGGCQVFKTGTLRHNLFYEVVPKSAEATAMLVEYINSHFDNTASGLVYCLSRKDSETVAKQLRENGISARAYHAWLDPDVRAAIHTSWTNNRTRVIVATVAFGLGINKTDCRFVIHHAMPKTVEGYYQESGRAGRDGAPARCLLLFRPSDVTRLSTMVCTNHSGIEHLFDMVKVCMDFETCRKQAIASHFGETDIEPCMNCDNCVRKAGDVPKEQDVTDMARNLVTILQHLENHKEQCTLNQLCKWWKSKKGPHGLDMSKLRAPAKLSKEDLEWVILGMLQQGVLRHRFAHTAYATNAYIRLGWAYKALLQGDLKVMACLPTA